MAGSLYTGHSIVFVSFTPLGRLDSLLPVFMPSAPLPKSSAWDLIFKSWFWGHTSTLVAMPPWSFAHVLLLKSICSPQRSWAPLLFTPKDQEKWTKMQWLIWTHSSAGGRKDARGKLLVLLPPKSNYTWQIGQAKHGLLHPVGQTGLTALMLAKHRIIKTRDGRAQTTSCPPQFYKASSAVYLVSS